MIQASGYLGAGADWNDYMSAGVYKVQNAPMTAEKHAPVGVYGYGTLVVFVAETATEYRKVQVFYPALQRNNVVMAIRTYNCMGNPESDWQPWRAISGTLLE